MQGLARLCEPWGLVGDCWGDGMDRQVLERCRKGFRYHGTLLEATFESLLAG